MRRAAAGERIVVTRYGRPHALLGPVAESGTQPRGRHRARLETWAKEREAFDRLPVAVRRRYHGRWVAIRGGRVLAADADHDRLFERAWKRTRGGTFFIGRVGAGPATIDMPGFVLG